MVQLKRIMVAVLLLLLCAVIVHDSAFHFDKNRIEIKRKHQSSQRSWSLFYGQRYLFSDSSMRYQKDFSAILKLIEPGRVLLSDRATSYYAAERLPVSVRNVHGHQGRNQSPSWRSFLDSRHACYLGHPPFLKTVREFIGEQQRLDKNRPVGAPTFKYILVNKDEQNSNLRRDCLWRGREEFQENAHQIASEIYNGEYLVLYELHDLTDYRPAL